MNQARICSTDFDLKLFHAGEDRGLAKGWMYAARACQSHEVRAHIVKQARIFHHNFIRAIRNSSG